MKNLMNFNKGVDEKGNAIKWPAEISYVKLCFDDQTKDFPVYSLGDRLFGVSKGEIQVMSKPIQLVAYLANNGVQTFFNNMTGCISKQEFFFYLCGELKKYEQITDLPHDPKIETYFYNHKVYGPNTFNRLDQVIDMFNPATPMDRDLIKAAFVTPFWGGAPGSKPAMLIESDGKDDGRGVGKTSLCDAISEVAGGYIDLQIASDIEEVKKRLLGATGQRIVRFDNVKSSKLSSAGIEGLITSKSISGRKNYSDGDTIRNYYTFILTMNDANFSKDMAERSVRIQLSRNPYTNDWNDQMDYIMTHYKHEIIADIMEILNTQPRVCDTPIRFGPWQRYVLSKINNTDAISNLIKERQVEIDSDKDELETMREFFEEEILKLRQYDPSTGSEPTDVTKHAYLIHRRVAKLWLKQHKGVKFIADRTAALELRRTKLFTEHRLAHGRYWLLIPSDTVIGPITGAFVIKKIGLENSFGDETLEYHKFQADSFGKILKMPLASDCDK
jgi:hypothetical protein